MNAEAVFINHSAYCFGKIMDTIRLLLMIRSEGTIPHVYIHELHQDRFKIIVDYLFTGDSKSFILMGS